MAHNVAEPVANGGDGGHRAAPILMARNAWRNSGFVSQSCAEVVDQVTVSVAETEPDSSSGSMPANSALEGVILFGGDYRDGAQAQSWGRSIARELAIDATFSWSYEDALEHHYLGGIGPVPQAMVAFDRWLHPHGFCLVGSEDGTDGYRAVVVPLENRDDAESAVTAPFDVQSLARDELDLSELDAEAVRSTKFPRSRRGYHPAGVDRHLDVVAARIQADIPTQAFHISPPFSRRDEEFGSRTLGYDTDEVDAFLLRLVAAATRRG